MKIKEIIEKYGVKPSKKLGQNFLVNQGIIEKIIKAADIKPDDIILEVGPGLGVLTRELAKRAKKVVAVEKDPRLAELLKEELKEFKNVEIVNEDILDLSESSLKKSALQDPAEADGPSMRNFSAEKYPCPAKHFSEKSFKIVANLPFNIASAIIQKFLEMENGPSEMILMIQKEVAQRICAKPPQMSILAVSVQFYSDPKILFHISRGSFFPAPKVDSSVIKLIPSENRLSPCPSGRRVFRPDLFFKIVKAGFSHPRKQLAGNLSKELDLDKKEIETWLAKNSLDPTRRAETLTVEDWKKLLETHS